MTKPLSLVISTLQMGGTQWPGKEFLVGMTLVTVMTMCASCSNSALSASFPYNIPKERVSAHRTAQTQRNTERVVEPPGVENPAMH